VLDRSFTVDQTLLVSMFSFLVLHNPCFAVKIGLWVACKLDVVVCMIMALLTACSVHTRFPSTGSQQILM